MDSLFVRPLSILAWPEVGKRGLLLPSSELNSLSQPDALGPDWPQFETSEDTRNFFSTHESDALIVCTSGVIAGGIGSRADEHGAWLYYFLLPAWRGTGMGGAALELAIERTQELWTARPIFARCTKSNFISMHLLKSAGFEIEAESSYDDDPLTLRLRLASDTIIS